MLSPCVTDDDYEAFRAVRIAVEPGERCPTVAELRASGRETCCCSSPRRTASSSAPAWAAGPRPPVRGFAIPRVLPEHRRQGVGSALLRALAEHCAGLGLPVLAAGADDEGSLAFAERFGFVEVDREIEPLRTVGREEPPSPVPAGVDVVTLSEQPELWAACFETFGKEALADFALYTPLDISAEEWNNSWRGDVMFLALHDGEVIGCAGLPWTPTSPDAPRTR